MCGEGGGGGALTQQLHFFFQGVLENTDIPGTRLH